MVVAVPVPVPVPVVVRARVWAWVVGGVEVALGQLWALHTVAWYHVASTDNPDSPGAHEQHHESGSFAVCPFLLLLRA